MLRFRVWLENVTVWRWRNWRAHRRGEQGSIHVAVGRLTYYKPQRSIRIERDKKPE